MVSATVRNEGAGEVFGDVHKFVDDGTGFVVLGKFIKVMGENFDYIMRRARKCFLPNLREAPDAGVRAAFCAFTSHTRYLRWLDVIKRRALEYVSHHLLDVWRFSNFHVSSNNGTFVCRYPIIPIARSIGTHSAFLMPSSICGTGRIRIFDVNTK